ncbi:uncharacterized protein LOC115736411 [Rhodamnia argentea]|uniref:Uncharacterized protein LOC115736411 n=1 Tax=Rhodamnia argentea TaxID=178133 RepID=A0A8B8NN89_9MYRT|nr:uncharacterized protein LOC115736411 [Rhodamnia argentea]
MNLDPPEPKTGDRARAMFRAFSTRRGRGRYEKLGREPAAPPSEAGKLKRTASLPAGALGSSSNPVPEVVFPANPQGKPTRKVSNSHPLFSLFDGSRRRKKATARPELARYLEYVKEGGLWDADSNKPIIHYS